MTIQRRLAALAVVVVAGLAVNQGVFQWASAARQTALDDVERSRARLVAVGDLRRRLDTSVGELEVASRAGAGATVTPEQIFRRRADVAGDLRRLSAATDPSRRQLLSGAADEAGDLFAEWEGFTAEAAEASAASAAHLARARQAARRLAYDTVPRLAEDEQLVLEATQAGLLGVERRITAITWALFALSVAAALGLAFWVATGLAAPPPIAAPASEPPPVKAVLPAIEPARADVPVDMRTHDAQKMQAIGRLAGGVAHDFNNLLTIIKGHTERLLEAAGTQPARIRLEEVQRAADRAAALTSQLLAFSRRQVMAPRIISLNDVVSDLQSLLRPLLGERITLELELDRALWPVRADPGQLAQVAMNLVVNARDAMPEGGVVVIRTANIVQGDPRVRQSPLLPASMVSLSVHDTGIGMDEATRSHIFEPFFTTKGVGQGTGLGLSTAHGIIGQSGGEILCASAPGKGTTFTIMLPRAAEDPLRSDVTEEDRRTNGDRIPGIRPW